MGCSFLATAGPGARHALTCLLGLIAAAAMPARAQAHPDVSAHLGYEDVSLEVGGFAGSSSLHRRLDTGSAQITETTGRLKYGIAMQYGTVIDLDPNDYFGHEADHSSLRIDREVFVGATANLRVHKDWHLFVTAGRVQMRLHDSLGDMARRGTLNEGTLMGWRMMAGVQHPVGLGLMTLGWQMTHYTGEHGSDPAQPTHGAAGHVAVEMTSPL